MKTNTLSHRKKGLSTTIASLLGGLALSSFATASVTMLVEQSADGVLISWDGSFSGRIFTNVFTNEVAYADLTSWGHLNGSLEYVGGAGTDAPVDGEWGAYYTLGISGGASSTPGEYRSSRWSTIDINGGRRRNTDYDYVSVKGAITSPFNGPSGALFTETGEWVDAAALASDYSPDYVGMSSSRLRGGSVSVTDNVVRNDNEGLDEYVFDVQVDYDSDTDYIFFRDKELADFNLAPMEELNYWSMNNMDDGDMFLTVRVVPEPSSSFLLGLGALGLFARRKR